MLAYRGRYFYVNPSLPYTKRVVNVPDHTMSDLKNYPHRQYTILNNERMGYNLMYLLDNGLWVHEEDLLPASTYATARDKYLYNPRLRSSDCGIFPSYNSVGVTGKGKSTWGYNHEEAPTAPKKSNEKKEVLDWSLFNKKLPILNQNL